MTAAGYVYCLKNAGLPGYIKIGRTINEVKLRAASLWKEYGTLEPFVEASRHMVSDCIAVETMVHRKLKKLRVAGSELFECSLKVAQNTIHWAAREVLGRPWYVRLWHWIVLPRPVAPPKRLAKGRGYYRKHDHWPLALFVIAVLIAAALTELKPTLPDWMPDAVLRTAGRIERRL
jgi:hypothetical protein